MWVQPDSVQFLAAGEYNENYEISAQGRRYVFRINHGSQLGLTNQIEYEYRALQHLSETGVTPYPYFCEPTCHEFPNGVLLMAYLRGTTFSYERDASAAARTFAKIHQTPPSEDLIDQYNPVDGIIKESEGLIERFPDHPRRKAKKKLLAYRDSLRNAFGEGSDLIADDYPCITNTEVNSGNFIVSGTTAYLVDWEKAVNSYRYQDLGHFLVPTTTLWKTDYRFDPIARREFLTAYKNSLPADLPFELLDEKTAIMERVILLRALSWCFMAYYEYTQQSRALTNQDTFARIRWYLDDIDVFLRDT